MSIDYKNTRNNKLKEYLVDVIKEITKNKEKININNLSKDIDSYSLDKISTDIEIERWVNGTEIHRDVFSFRSRKRYSLDEIENLENIGFFEIFEKKIFDNNKLHILPKIEGIEEIECLNPGSMVNFTNNTAEFDIQIQITYKI